MFFTQKLYRTFIGDRAFYKKLLHVMVPAIIHMSVANFVNLLDNLMVGSLGTAEISGVAVTNQLMFVFNMVLFGVLGGTGIFSAQYFGARDMDGVRNVFRAKMWLSLLMTGLGLALLIVKDTALIGVFLQGEGDPVLAEGIMAEARRYLYVMLWGLLPFAVSQSYATTMREAGELHVPMRAGLVAVGVNLVGNYLLIFGHLGCPRMGVVGAAVATVISRYVEMAIVLYAGHRKDIFSFFRGVYRSLKVPGSLIRSIFTKGAPLIINEILWSVGMAKIAQIYTLRGLTVLAAINISSTITNLFNVILIANGTTVAVIIGQMLGAGETERAKEDIWKIIFFGFSGCTLVSVVMGFLSPYFPLLYNTEDAVRLMAQSFILSQAVLMPVNSLSNAAYFTLRSGGRTIITFLVDAAFNWTIGIPFTLFLIHGTALPIIPLYFISQSTALLKAAIGITLVRKGVWVRNIVGGKQTVS